MTVALLFRQNRGATAPAGVSGTAVTVGVDVVTIGGTAVTIG